MATVIGGISRLFQPTIAVLAAEKLCQGFNPWYFLIGLRMVTLFFAYAPWDSLKNDLTCQWPSDSGDAKTFCAALCYNQRFPIPFSSAWAFYFVAIIFIVALMKLVYITETVSSGKDVEAAAQPKPAPKSSRPGQPAGQPKYASWRYGIYVFGIVLILVIELLFTWVLLGLQLPVMNQGIVMCYPNNVACPSSVQCALNGQSDKRTILWLLAFSAVANASVCIGYLATLGGQACGFCGGCTGRGTAGAAGQGSCGREAVERGCPCEEGAGNFCQGGGGGWARAHGCRCDGVSGCRCQTEGGGCDCPRGQDPGWEAACDCQSNRWGPGCFHGSEAWRIQDATLSREDAERKLLRGDTELGAERKDWRPGEERVQIREPLTTGPQKGRGGSPTGGRPVKYVAKYHVWKKRRA